VDFLKDPKKYTRLGGAAPKGVLFRTLPRGSTTRRQALHKRAAWSLGNLSLSVGRLQRQKELRAGFFDVLSKQEHGL
jgi:hypothetical protein